jgi:hypothetical protein
MSKRLGNASLFLISGTWIPDQFPKFDHFLLFRRSQTPFSLNKQEIQTSIQLHKVSMFAGNFSLQTNHLIIGDEDL